MIDGRIDQVIPPRSVPRTANERLRRQLQDQRIRSADQPRRIVLPGVHSPYGGGSPPAGAFLIHADKED